MSGPFGSHKPLRPTDGRELDSVLREHDRVLVEFYTKGCALCQAMEPVLGNVAREMGATNRGTGAGDEATPASRDDEVVAMVNPGEDVDLVDEYDVRSVPTLILFEAGEEVARMDEGFRGAEAVVSFVERHTDERTV